MKQKILAVFCFAVLALPAAAQDDVLKPFKVVLSGGYALPGGNGSKGGACFGYEPKYAVRPDLALGLRLEGAMINRFQGYNSSGEEMDVNITVTSSVLGTCDYYFTNRYKFRPFAGAGMGTFSFVSGLFDLASFTADMQEGTRFGGMVRAGFEAEHFRFGIEYNIAPDSKFNGFDANGNPAVYDIKNGYFGFKIGVCIGGGPKKAR